MNESENESDDDTFPISGLLSPIMTSSSVELVSIVSP